MALVCGKVTGDVYINPAKVPDSFIRATRDAVLRYFEQPGVQEEFEAWLVEYKKEQQAKACQNSESLELKGG